MKPSLIPATYILLPLLCSYSQPLTAREDCNLNQSLRLEGEGFRRMVAERLPEEVKRFASVGYVYYQFNEGTEVLPTDHVSSDPVTRQVYTVNELIVIHLDDLPGIIGKKISDSVPGGSCTDRFHVASYNLQTLDDGTLAYNFRIHAEKWVCAHWLFGYEDRLDEADLDGWGRIDPTIDPAANTYSFATSSGMTKHDKFGKADLLPILLPVIGLVIQDHIIAPQVEKEVAKARRALAEATDSLSGRNFKLARFGHDKQADEFVSNLENRLRLKDAQFGRPQGRLILTIMSETNRPLTRSLACSLWRNLRVQSGYVNGYVSFPTQVAVNKDEGLWQVAERLYGDGYYYQVLLNANPELRKNPNRVREGQILRVYPLHRPAGEGGAVIERESSLWSVAEKELGSGERYREILACNPRLAPRPRLVFPAEGVILPGSPECPEKE